MTLDEQTIRLVEEAVTEVRAQEELCPKCKDGRFTPYGKPYVKGISAAFPALSRRDNKTYVCSDCGMREAMEDLAGTLR